MIKICFLLCSNLPVSHFSNHHPNPGNTLLSTSFAALQRNNSKHHQKTRHSAFFCWPTQPTFPRALSLSLPRIPFNLFNRKSFAPGQQPTSTGTVLCAAKMKNAVFLSHLKLKVEATRSEIGGTNSSSNSHKHTLSKNVATITKCQSGQIPGKKSMRKSEADERVFPLHQMQRQGRGPPPTIGTKLITSPKLVRGRE